MVDQAYGEPAGRQTDLLVDVAVDDVVAAALALDLAGLAAADVVADGLLEGQGDVLGDVPEPGALVEPLDEAAARPREQECSRSPGSICSRLSVNPGSVSGGEVLERPEVDDEVDRLLVGPDVRAAVDPGLDDRQVGDGVRSRGLGSVLQPAAVGLRARLRRSTAGETSPAAMSRANRFRSRPATESSAASVGSTTGACRTRDFSEVG